MLNRTTALAMVHDVGLAAWFGGAWMGAIGLNGATIEVDDHTQRTRVANAGWFRWAPIAGAALLAHVSSAYALGRLRPTPQGREPGSVGVRRVRTAVTLLAMIATAETGISGQRVVRGGDVPVATATIPIRATPPEVAAAQRRLRVAQWLVPTFTGAIFVLEAIQRQQGGHEAVRDRR
ncbi:MAG: hypothetical protein WD638_07400 [Nitriliruptoraceae bacterium]